MRLIFRQKSGVTLVLCMLSVLILFSPVTPAYAAGVLIGDANSDGKIDIRDLVCMKKYIWGVSESENAAADVNADGKLNADDMVVLKKYLLGIGELAASPYQNKIRISGAWNGLTDDESDFTDLY